MPIYYLYNWLRFLVCNCKACAYISLSVLAKLLLLAANNADQEMSASISVCGSPLFRLACCCFRSSLKRQMWCADADVNAGELLLT